MSEKITLKDLIFQLKNGTVEERYEAASKIHYFSNEELMPYFEDLCLAVNDTGSYTTCDSDPWGGYYEYTNYPAAWVSETLLKLNTEKAFIPLLRAAMNPHQSAKSSIIRSLNELLLPKGNPEAELLLQEAFDNADLKELIDPVYRKWHTEGKSWKELILLLDHTNRDIRVSALIKLGAIKLNKNSGDQRLLVRELRARLQQPSNENPIGYLSCIWEHATVDEMLDAILLDYWGKPEFQDEIQDQHLWAFGYCFVMLGFWMGPNSRRALPAMKKYLLLAKNRLSDKDLREWYACFIKITSKPDRLIVEGMIELYERSDDWGKDNLLTSMQYIFSQEDLLIPFFRRHSHDDASALGGTTTLGLRIKEILKERGLTG